MKEKKYSGEKKTILYKLIILLIFFNVWFPKAGIKISGIPFTISNILFFITFFIWILYKIKEKKMNSSKVILCIILSILYFILKYVLIYFKTNNFTNYITYIIPLIVYPIIYIMFIDQINTNEELNVIVKIILYGFIMICVYSLIQFVLGIEKTAIPGLTVNLTDYRTMGTKWFMQKSNGTDVSNAKIVSTYQNGNLFGINLILIYPMIYMVLKKQNKNIKLMLSLILFIICGFLTLSRTAWLGVILFLFFGVVFENEKTKSSSLRKFIIIILCLVSVFCVFKYMPSVTNRFFNTDSSDWISMSGRTEGLFKVFHTVNSSNSILAYIIGPEGIINYSGLAYEVLPLAVFAQTGIIGIILLYLVYYNLLSKIKANNPISKGIKLSMIIWLIIGCIECGYWLPPTALNVFLLLAIGYKSTDINMEVEKI